MTPNDKESVEVAAARALAECNGSTLRFGTEQMYWREARAVLAVVEPRVRAATLREAEAWLRMVDRELNDAGQDGAVHTVARSFAAHFGQPAVPEETPPLYRVCAEWGDGTRSRYWHSDFAEIEGALARIRKEFPDADTFIERAVKQGWERER